MAACIVVATRVDCCLHSRTSTSLGRKGLKLRDRSRAKLGNSLCVRSCRGDDLSLEGRWLMLLACSSYQVWVLSRTALQRKSGSETGGSIIPFENYISTTL